jgi:hypothetical protein
MSTSRRPPQYRWALPEIAAAAAETAMLDMRWHDTTAPIYDWEEKALAVVREIRTLPVSAMIANNEQGLLLALRNVGSSPALAIASALFTSRMPDSVNMPTTVREGVFMPYRILDAGRFVKGTPATIPTDVAQAFDAIWIAEEYASAYSYIVGLISASGPASVQPQEKRTRKRTRPRPT